MLFFSPLEQFDIVPFFFFLFVFSFLFSKRIALPSLPLLNRKAVVLPSDSIIISKRIVLHSSSFQTTIRFYSSSTYSEKDFFLFQKISPQFHFFIKSTLLEVILYQKACFSNIPPNKVYLFLNPFIKIITISLLNENSDLLCYYREMKSLKKSDMIYLDNYRVKDEIYIIRDFINDVLASLIEEGFPLISVKPSFSSSSSVIFFNTLDLSKIPFDLLIKKYLELKKPLLESSSRILFPNNIAKAKTIDFKSFTVCKNIYLDELEKIQQVPFFVNIILLKKKLKFFLHNLSSECFFSKKILNSILEIYALNSIVSNQKSNLLKFFLKINITCVGLLTHEAVLFTNTFYFLQDCLVDERNKKLAFLKPCNILLEVYSLLFGDLAVAGIVNSNTVSVLALKQLFTNPKNSLLEKFGWIFSDIDFLTELIDYFFNGGTPLIESAKFWKKYQIKNDTCNNFILKKKNFFPILNWFYRNFKRIFSGFFEFLKFLNKRNPNTSVCIFWKKNKTYFHVNKTKKVSFDFKKAFKQSRGKRMGFEVNQKKTFHAAKTGHSVFQNLIDSLYGTVVFNLLTQFEKKGVIVYWINNSFGIPQNQVNCFKKAYKQELFQTIFKAEFKNIIAIKGVDFDAFQKKIFLKKNCLKWLEFNQKKSNSSLKKI